MICLPIEPVSYVILIWKSTMSLHRCIETKQFYGNSEFHPYKQHFIMSIK